MTSFEAMLYRAAFELARQTVIGAASSEEVLGLAEGYRAGRDLIKARISESTPKLESKPAPRISKS